MQSEAADFAPGAATWRTGRNIRVVSDSVHSLHYIKIRDVLYKTGSTLLLALSPEEDRATATGNMYRKFGEIWTCGF